MGQRSISQLRLIDFMMALLIGNIIAHPLSDEQLGLKGSMITISVLVILYTVGVYLSIKWRALRKFLEPTVCGLNCCLYKELYSQNNCHMNLYKRADIHCVHGIMDTMNVGSNHF